MQCNFKFSRFNMLCQNCRDADDRCFECAECYGYFDVANLICGECNLKSYCKDSTIRLDTWDFKKIPLAGDATQRELSPKPLAVSKEVAVLNAICVACGYNPTRIAILFARAFGLNYREIANGLNLTPEGVRYHLQRIVGTNTKALLKQMRGTKCSQTGAANLFARDSAKAAWRQDMLAMAQTVGGNGTGGQTERPNTKRARNRKMQGEFDFSSVNGGSFSKGTSRNYDNAMGCLGQTVSDLQNLKK